MTYQHKPEIKMYLTRDSTYVEINGFTYKDGEKTESIVGSVDISVKRFVEKNPTRWAEFLNKPPRKGEHLVRVHSGKVRRTSSELLEILDISPELFSQGRNLDVYEDQKQIAREVQEKIARRF